MESDSAMATPPRKFKPEISIGDGSFEATLRYEFRSPISGGSQESGRLLLKVKRQQPHESSIALYDSGTHREPANDVHYDYDLGMVADIKMTGSDPDKGLLRKVTSVALNEGTGASVSVNDEQIVLSYKGMHFRIFHERRDLRFLVGRKTEVIEMEDGYKLLEK